MRAALVSDVAVLLVETVSLASSPVICFIAVAMETTLLGISGLRWRLSHVFVERIESHHVCTPQFHCADARFTSVGLALPSS
jgi:hypothetical protein